MKISKFRVKTINGELVKLEEIETLGFGICVSDRYKPETKELFITCEKGQLRFNLEDVCEISFNLDHEKSFLHIESRYFSKEEGGEDGKI